MAHGANRRTCVGLGIVVAIASLAAATAEAQLIVETFDGYAAGTPPPAPWWTWGTSGTTDVDDAVFRGTSGKSVELNRVAFDYQPFAFGRNVTTLEGEVVLSYYFMLTGGSDREALCVFGRDSGDDTIAWWVAHGGLFGNAVATYSEIEGWTHVMDVSTDSWYGVRLDVDTGSCTYDITVWEDANPTNTTTVTGRNFRNGILPDLIDEIQLGDFYASFSDQRSAYVDDLVLIGPVVFRDGFSSGDATAWSSATP